MGKFSEILRCNDFAEELNKQINKQKTSENINKRKGVATEKAFEIAIKNILGRYPDDFQINNNLIYPNGLHAKADIAYIDLNENKNYLIEIKRFRSIKTYCNLYNCNEDKAQGDFKNFPRDILVDIAKGIYYRNINCSNKAISCAIFLYNDNEKNEIETNQIIANSIKDVFKINFEQIHFSEKFGENVLIFLFGDC